MSKRQAAIKAQELLEKFRNCDGVDSETDEEGIDEENESENELEETVSPYSDSSDNDSDDGNELVNQHIDEAIQSVIQDANDYDDPNLDKTSKSNIIWTRLKNGEETSLRKKIVFDECKTKPGLTTYATRRIDQTKLSAFFLIFDMTMINLMLKFTNINAASDGVVFTKEDMLGFIGVLFCRGLFCPNAPVAKMWSSLHGVKIISEFMSRNNFEKIKKYLRFDDKATREQRKQTDKFCAVRSLWDKFLENSKACYTPHQHLTIDEQLMPSKNRCEFIQYNPNKPDKFGILTWLMVEVKSKYIVNGNPYLGKDSSRPADKLLGEYVVESLIDEYKNNGYCITADNFFTSLRLVRNLIKIKTTYIGTVKKNKPELPSIIKSKGPLYSSNFYEEEKGVTLTIYQGRKDKNVALLSSFHEKIAVIQDKVNLPNIIDDYNKTKVGVDIVDNMTRICSVRCKTRRWPLQYFFNILNMSGINSYILYKKCNNYPNLTRRNFLTGLVEKLFVMLNPNQTLIPVRATPTTPVTPKSTNKRSLSSSILSTPLSSKKANSDSRVKCQIRFCKENKTNITCNFCNRPTCGVCIEEQKIHTICKICHNDGKKF